MARMFGFNFSTYLPTLVQHDMDLTMSMRVDRHRQSGACRIPARAPATWIPDARVRRCFACNVEFSFWRRKHHCRSCGRIFCDACSNARERIPSYFCADQAVAEHPEQPRRVCIACAHQLQRSSQVEWLVRALAVMPVTMEQLMALRLLNKHWNAGVNTMIGLYRGLQYRCAGRRYSSMLCDFLWSHYREFVGHIPWQLHVFAALKQRGQLRARLPFLIQAKALPCSCRRLMCSRTCRSAMSVDDILKVASAMTLSEYAIQNWVIVSWHNMQPIVHRHMMPWWVYIAQRFKRMFTEGLLPLCQKRIDLTFALYFECDLQKNKRNWKLLHAVQKRLRARLNRTVKASLDASIALVRLLVHLDTTPNTPARITEFFLAHESVHLPWNPKVQIVDIDAASLYRMQSSSKPLVFSCWTQKGKRLEFILKGEDVRTDRLAMTVGYWINSFANASVQLYDVFPLNTRLGVVAMIPQATTLYDVRYHKKMSLLNYILQCNPTVPIRAIQERIVTSASGACLLAFTMGLGDRHLENILVTPRGRLVHVDFGYILGDDPKHAYTHMRLTEDMMDAMGGRHSAAFEAFQRSAQQSYAALRRHCSFWYHLLSAEYFIFQDRSRHWKRIRSHVMDRFVPGEWNEQASLHIDMVVDRAARSSWSQQLADLTHAASNHMGEMFQMDL